MARASLYSSANESETFDNDTLLVEARYSVPLCWLAIAASEDARPAPDGGRSLLVIPLAAARQRFAARRAIIEKCFSNIDLWLTAWHKMLEMAAGPYLKMQVGEILAEYEDEDVMLAEALSFFATPAPPALATLLQLTLLRDKYNRSAHTLNDDMLAFFLVGGKCAPWLPWSDPGEDDEIDEIPLLRMQEPAPPPRQPLPRPAPKAPPAAKKPWWQIWKK